MLFERGGHNGLSIRTVCTDRKRSLQSVYVRIRSVKCISSNVSSERIYQSRDDATTNKPAHMHIYREYYMTTRGYEFYLRVLNSISHEWAQRISISIKGFCHKKQASYRCIHRSLSVSAEMTRLKRNK